MLEWYDQNARILPWRIPPRSNRPPDPYFIWLSEVMLQQTTVATVKTYFQKFTETWPSVVDLAAAEDADVMAAWAGLGYYARARNLLACARAVVRDHGGVFPGDAAKLQKLPGIGPYTSAAIASIAFDQPAPVMDGNIERVVSRVCRVETPLPAAKAEIMGHVTAFTPTHRTGDYAQAMMDLGATICTPKAPKCMACPIADHCAVAQMPLAETLPQKAPNKPKPVRLGFCYIAANADHVLTERRPNKGLLGGMLGFPGSDWGDAPDPKPPFAADWTPLPGQVTHVFTHFRLELTVMTTNADIPDGLSPTVRNTFDPASMPTVMRKAWDHLIAAGANSDKLAGNRT